MRQFIQYGYENADGTIAHQQMEIDDLLCDLSFDDRTHAISDPIHPCFGGWDWYDKLYMPVARERHSPSLLETLREWWDG